MFSYDVKAAILVFQNNETAATLEYQSNPVGVELVSYANKFVIDTGHVSEDALLQERALAIFQNWPGRPGHDKHDSDGFFRTLRVDHPLAFFSEENKRRLCLNCVKPLRSPQQNISTSQSCFLSSNWFFECEHLFIDKPMVITEPVAVGVLVLGLGSKLYPSNMPRMLNKDPARFKQSLSRGREIEQTKERLAGRVGFSLNPLNPKFKRRNLVLITLRA